MNQILTHLTERLDRLRDERGFLAGRVALVIFIIGLIVVAAVIAFIIPGS
ncbi:MAG TPA: hypothetical protein VE800_06885 [Actinomycetota bacterium]|jgi:hypothetical protein|nr:hypothetical protein [Actinomycetota bacterium]